jgi:bifunctional UDP-N-acetylglucosamine pyrophosphorylase/glucosamine-1-phosphate N-acetyltransferase
MSNLPEGSRAIIVNHCKDDVIASMDGFDVTFCEQPDLNGTGGAILAAKQFISNQPCERLLITMGDVPFIQKETYAQMVRLLGDNDIVVLGFRPEDKKQYGVLEIESERVTKITEWKYWKDYPEEKQRRLSICNSGIYAVRKDALETFLPVLAVRPQIVTKEVNGRLMQIEEFFITDLIEYMVADGRNVGFLLAADEVETMGIDDQEALEKAQAIYDSQ